eukprot:6230263-Pyramimonas_sp.AAC.1
MECDDETLAAGRPPPALGQRPREGTERRALLDRAEVWARTWVSDLRIGGGNDEAEEWASWRAPPMGT